MFEAKETVPFYSVIFCIISVEVIIGVRLYSTGLFCNASQT